MGVKWQVTAGEGKRKGCRHECELKGRPQISLWKEGGVWVCEQLGKARCIGILCKSFFLLRKKAKFPWAYEQMVLGLQKILLLLNSLITVIPESSKYWPPEMPPHTLSSNSSNENHKSLLSIPAIHKLKQKRNKRTTPTSLSCLKCCEARYENCFGVLFFVSALDIRRWRERTSYI